MNKTSEPNINRINIELEPCAELLLKILKSS